MIYSVDYYDKRGRLWCLFEIQLWIERNDNLWGQSFDEGWRTDSKTICFGENIAQYVYDAVKDEETLKDFQKDLQDILGIRHFLHMGLNNKWHENPNEAEKALYDYIQPAINSKIQEFADKWNFWIRK